MEFSELPHRDRGRLWLVIALDEFSLLYSCNLALRTAAGSVYRGAALTLGRDRSAEQQSSRHEYGAYQRHHTRLSNDVFGREPERDS